MMTKVSPKCVQIALKKYISIKINILPLLLPFFFFFWQLWDLGSLIRGQTPGSESTEF